MWARIFGEEEKTRFDSYLESKCILPFVSRLRSKESELKAKVENSGPNSLEYGKYIIVNRLLFHIDEKISIFNNSKEFANKEDELKAFLVLIIDLSLITSSIRKNYFSILKQPRNWDHWLAKEFIWGGSVFTTAYAASMYAFSPMGIVSAAVVGGSYGYGYFTSLAGLNYSAPASLHLITQLDETLSSIYKKLYALRSQWQDPTAQRTSEIQENNLHREMVPNNSKS